MNDKEPERIPLTGREYFALREIFGIVDCYDNALNYLEKRAKMLPGVWRDMKLISKKAETVTRALLSTVPKDKLLQISIELRNTVVNVDVVRSKSVVPQERKLFTYVPTREMSEVLLGLAEEKCAFCSKTKREAKKCPWFSAISAMYQYELPDVKEDHCQLCGYFIGTSTLQDDLDELGKGQENA